MMNLNTIAATASIAGALGLAALGTGLGVANAVPPVPATPGTPWQQDDGHGHGHGNNGDWGDGDQGRGAWYGPGYGPYLGPIAACVNASGPFGYVSGSLCI
jgi:hypothetical protein